ncbi:MAG: HRDC domain-containing protein [Planctomycetota bacterium]
MDAQIEDLPPPTLVATPEGLENLLGRIERETEIAVDTEADSFYSYRDKVCLFQVSAGGEDWLIDPLADLDLAGLGAILADESITKVFHDAEYDVLILRREFGFSFRSLFDTRVAAAVLGSSTPGLASVLHSHFGVQLDKSQQRSNWAQRPLSDEQIAYARLDTRFLVPLMHRQRDELREQDRAMIVDAECRRLERLEPPPNEFNADDFVRIKGARALDPRAASALRELYAMREKLAEKNDVPPFRILGNKAMIQIAQRRPRSDKELLRVEGVTPKVLSRIGDRIRRALERAGRRGPLQRFPSHSRRDGSIELDELGSELHDRLKRLRKDEADARGIESSYLINRHVLLDIARQRPSTSDALSAIDGFAQWQSEMFGDAILDVVRRFERDAASGAIRPRRRKPRRTRA